MIFFCIDTTCGRDLGEKQSPMAVRSWGLVGERRLSLRSGVVLAAEVIEQDVLVFNA